MAQEILEQSGYEPSTIAGDSILGYPRADPVKKEDPSTVVHQQQAHVASRLGIPIIFTLKDISAPIDPAHITELFQPKGSAGANSGGTNPDCGRIGPRP
eukprot:9849626-Karenia_brevis.AAC.1